MGKPALSPDDVADFLTTHFGPVAGLTPITEGQESRAFGFAALGQGFVLRVNAGRAGFDKDRLAQQRFGRNLPVPEIVLIAPLGQSFACVSHRAAGRTLQDLGPGEAYALGAEVLAVMDAMAACDLTGFAGYGPFDAAGQGAFASWAGCIADVTGLNWSALAGLPLVRPALDRVQRFARTLPDMRALVHGDFGSNNVLTDGARITGVIDWSEAMIGDPLYDLANLLFWRTWLPCMAEHCAWVETHAPARLVETDILRLYQLHIGLTTLHATITHPDKHLRDWALDRIDDLLTQGR